MPADPLAHVKPGDPVDEVVSADVMNALKDGVRRGNVAKLPPPSAGKVSSKLTPTLEVLIRNDTGADLPAFSVLRITGWVVTPVTYPFDVRARPVLSGDTPNAATNLIAILSEPILEDEIGRAVIPGPVAVCDIVINDAGHEYAQPISGDNTRLTSATSGPARIAAKETSGAVRRAIVVLGDGQGNTATDYWVRVTSLTPDGTTGYYPAVVTVFDPDKDAKTWSGATSCWAWVPNGEFPDDEKRYRAYPWGTDGEVSPTNVYMIEPDIQAKVSGDDTTSGYLEDKIVAGTGITINVLNDGANEQLEIENTGAGADIFFKISSDDTTADYGENKLLAGSGISLTKNNPTGNETLTIATTSSQGTHTQVIDDETNCAVTPGDMIYVRILNTVIVSGDVTVMIGTPNNAPILATFTMTVPFSPTGDGWGTATSESNVAPGVMTGTLVSGEIEWRFNAAADDNYGFKFVFTYQI